MEKNTKVILIVVGVLILFVTGFKYNQFYINKDYTFLTQIDCDPAVETCFQLLEENQDPETGIIYYDGSPYKYAEMDGYVAPTCLEDVSCPDFTCDSISDEEAYCGIYTCSVAEEEDDVDWDTEWWPEDGWEECIGAEIEN